MMKKYSNKKLRGFTLIELIIVMAIFGVIMAAAISLMSPVGKIFRNTAQYEQTRAAIDNTQRYLSGTLRYADRFSMYIQYTDPTTSSLENVINENNIKSNVANFAGKYFYCGDKSSQLTDPSNTPVYVLVFDNQNYKISKYTFSPKSGNNWINTLNYDATSLSYSANDSSWDVSYEDYALNKELFEDYGFQVFLGSGEYKTSDTGAYAFSWQDYSKDYYPNFSNLAFTIVSFKNIKDDTGAIISRECLNQATALSFSLVNVIDVNTVNGLNSSVTPKTDSSRYYDSVNSCFAYTPEVSRGNIYPDASEKNKVNRSNDSFYIIYTLPDRVETYQNNNQENYDSRGYVVTTVTTPTK